MWLLLVHHILSLSLICAFGQTGNCSTTFLSGKSCAVLPENKQWSMVKKRIKCVKIKKVGLPVYMLRLPFFHPCWRKLRRVVKFGSISKELRTLMMKMVLTWPFLETFPPCRIWEKCHNISNMTYDIQIWHKWIRLILVSKEASGPRHLHPFWIENDSIFFFKSPNFSEH